MYRGEEVAMTKHSKYLMKSIFALAICLSALLAYSFLPQYAPEITPDKWVEELINAKGIKDHPRGENFCWYARVGMDRGLNYFEVTKDPAWLDASIKYYDFLLGKMDTAPDGYKGWIGPYGYDRKYWSDVHVGDALLFNGILDFVLLVKNDPILKEKYRAKIAEYTESAKKNFVEKYDARGTFLEDGPFGAYVQHDKYVRADKFDEWVSAPGASQSGMSQPFNKQNEAAQVSLRLFRITGDKQYRDKATKIYYFMKSRFQFYDNHYVWNYWEPFGPNDIDLKRKRSRHWIGIHPFRSGYTASEVDQIADAYHTGIVFDDRDMQRIINTNIEVMWNKDLENPDFIASNGLGSEGDTTGLGAFRARYGHSNARKNAGELWTALLDFSQTVRDIYERRVRNRESFYWYYYKNVAASNPPGLKRKHTVDGVYTKEFNFTESSDLYCVAALPSHMKKGGETILIAKSMNPGMLEIALYPDQVVRGFPQGGTEPVLILYDGEIEGTNDIGGNALIITWDGKDPSNGREFTGDYRIRWTLNNGYREFPVNIN